MNWIIIAALVVIAFFFLRMRHIKHKVFLIIAIFALLFIYVTGSQLLANQEVNWRDASEVGGVIKTYFSWLVSVGSNFKEIAGNVIKQDWKLNETGT